MLSRQHSGRATVPTVSREQLRLARLVGVAVVIAVVSYVVIGLKVSNSGILQPSLRTSGKPATAEVAIRVRNDFHSEHAAASTCDQPSAGHWTCSVRLTDGRNGIARAVWHGQTEKLSVSLDSAGFR
jgi:hypothetical protein